MSQAYTEHNDLKFRFGRKKSVILPMIAAFIASVISVSIPTNESSGKYIIFIYF